MASVYDQLTIEQLASPSGMLEDYGNQMISAGWHAQQLSHPENCSQSAVERARRRLPEELVKIVPYSDYLNHQLETTGGLRERLRVRFGSERPPQTEQLDQIAEQLHALSSTVTDTGTAEQVLHLIEQARELLYA